MQILGQPKTAAAAASPDGLIKESTERTFMADVVEASR